MHEREGEAASKVAAPLHANGALEVVWCPGTLRIIAGGKIHGHLLQIVARLVHPEPEMQRQKAGVVATVQAFVYPLLFLIVYFLSQPAAHSFS